jgi:hypothetical protein
MRSCIDNDSEVAAESHPLYGRTAAAIAPTVARHACSSERSEYGEAECVRWKTDAHTEQASGEQPSLSCDAQTLGDLYGHAM